MAAIPVVTIEQDILVRQGSRYRAVVQVDVEWLPTLAGYSARGMVRRFQSLSSTEDPLAVLDTYLVVDQPNSLITIDIPANVSAAWSWRKGHYDIEVFDGNAAHDVRVLQGQMTVDPEATHT
jgi:hypothetical protein